MKSILQKLIGSLAVVLMTAISVYAQVPQGFNFQAIARGANGEILADQALGVKVSLIKGTEGENPLYEETHTVTTNPLGLIQIVIGEGTAAEGQSFSAINFGNDNYFVKLAIDPTGGTEYADLGTTRLLSVPYALVAHKAIEGGSSGGIITEYNLNTADPDSSFVINLEGDKTAKPLQVFSKSSGFNGAIWGEAISDASNPNNQRGTYGMANGLGTGQHIGVFGGAVNFEATGGGRTGIHGQAASKGKYNFGAYGIAQGDGSGEIVPLGEEVGGNFGSFNIAGGFYSQGNLNGNVGVEAQASGDKGSRIDFGVISRAIGTSNSPNIGVRGEAFNSPVQNVALEGDASGTGTTNLGLRLNVFNGSSNIGMEVNADTAAILNGHSVINGDLTINGTLNYVGGIGGASTIYNLDTANPDSSFLVNVTGSESGSAIIATASTAGGNAGLEGKAVSASGNGSLQVGTYGEAGGEGTGSHLGIFGSAVDPDATDGTRYGVYGQARSKTKSNLGVFGIGLGEGNGDIVLPGQETPGEIPGSFTVGVEGWARNNLNGNIGTRGYAYGTAGARVNTGVVGESRTTASGTNIGVEAFSGGSQSENWAFQGTADGSNAKNLGMRLNVSNGTSNIGLEVNADTAAIMNGFTQVNSNFHVNGDITHSGSITQTSDRNLKENIQNLEYGLGTIMKLRPTSYNFRGDGEYNGLKLSTGLHYGLIAQEVEEVLPSLVKDNKHTYLAPAEGAGPNNPEEKTEVKNMDYKTMNYTELIPVLIKAVQEQQEEIEKLRKQIESLKKEN